jgi:hypothetical protein
MSLKRRAAQASAGLAVFLALFVAALFVSAVKVDARSSAKKKRPVSAVKASAKPTPTPTKPGATAPTPTSTKPVAKVTSVPPSAVQLFSLPTGPLVEISGCAILKSDPTTVWMHNDSGNAPQLFALDLTKRTVKTVDVSGVDLVDWEDMAATPGGGVIVGDIGDNDMKRKTVDTYLVENLASSPLTASHQELRYEDGPHNAESLLVDPTDTANPPKTYVITKDSNGESAAYRADGNVLRKVAPITISTETFLVPNQITAADALPDGSGIILRTYQFGYLLRRKAGEPFESVFRATPEQFPLPLMAQAEALCVAPDGKTLFTTTESRGASTISYATAPVPPHL